MTEHILPSKGLKVTLYVIILIGLIFLLPMILLVGQIIFYNTIGKDDSNNPIIDNSISHLHEEFKLAVRFDGKTNFTLYHPQYVRNGEVLLIMTQISLLTRLDQDEYLKLSYESVNDTQYIRIDGFLDEFFIHNIVDHQDEKGHYYEAYLSSIEVEKYNSEAYFYLVPENSDVLSLYSKYTASTNWCDIRKEVYREEGVDDFEFISGWNSFPKGIGVSCA